MLQQPQPEDFVIATGVQHSVRDFINAAAAEYGIELDWSGSGPEEVARIRRVREKRFSSLFSSLKPGNTIARVDPRYYRPAEVDALLGDATKARKKLGWIPEISFKDLVAEMAREDLALAQRDDLAQSRGHKPIEARQQ
jgi:GDPmannose 4,6-dehydratase